MTTEPFEPNKEAIQAIYDAVDEETRAVIHAVLEIEAANQPNAVRKIGDRIRSIIVEDGE